MIFCKDCKHLKPYPWSSNALYCKKITEDDSPLERAILAIDSYAEAALIIFKPDKFGCALGKEKRRKP